MCGTDWRKSPLILQNLPRTICEISFFFSLALLASWNTWSYLGCWLLWTRWNQRIRWQPHPLLESQSDALIIAPHRDPSNPSNPLVAQKHHSIYIWRIESILKIHTMQWNKNYIFKKDFWRKRKRQRKNKEWEWPHMCYIFGKPRMQQYQIWPFNQEIFSKFSWNLHKIFKTFSWYWMSSIKKLSINKSSIEKSKFESRESIK